jgi:uncharacterized protein (TIGR04168 family)
MRALPKKYCDFEGVWAQIEWRNMSEAIGGSVAVVGDLHSSWEQDDVRYFQGAGYPVLLVTGDLGHSGTHDGRHIARSFAQLSAQVLVMPGNNDATDYPHIRAELTYRRARADLLLDAVAEGHSLPPSPDSALLCGYSVHPVALHGFDFTLVAGRPFSMGGPELSYPQALSRLYEVHSLSDSTERLCSLVDAAETEHLVFFAHNGPSGLGALPEDIWGRDFHPDAGDWGDPDLRAAIEHARQRGKRTLAVVAGHMHWGLTGREGALRRWQLREDGVLYVNAARVPRVFSDGEGNVVRHHVSLTLGPGGAVAEERLIVD